MLAATKSPKCVRTSAEKSVYVGDMPSGIYVVAVNGYKTKVVKN